MRRLAFAWALFASLALATPTVVAGQTVDARSALEQAESFVERASLATGAERAEFVRAALDALAEVPDVAASAWLSEPLKADPPALDRARARLGAALGALGDPRAVSDPVVARATLARLLENPPFQRPSLISLLPGWLVPVALLIDAAARLLWNLVRWPFDRILDLLSTVLGALAYGPAALVLALLVAAGLVLLYRRGLRSAIVAQAELSIAAETLPPTAGEALAAAQRQAAAGRYREACHFVFLSTLLWIEERGLARFDPSATNREHLARLEPQAPVAQALRPLVAGFDRLWYGQESVTDADYRELLTLAGRVREVVS